ncbi:uncharacterized protein LOC113752363 [Coffea eugenioides]|uniref:uncharacterized protein LOC113752363 n=1 Tax=Coffea eugenioides TaxID=49369 RepID=UPI000F6145CE|nr:uncharacterized protein LOC113752363 [Coffea eugenioides]
MTLRSGREVEGPKLMISKDKSEDRIEKELEKEGIGKTNSEVTPEPMIKIRSNSPYFPSKLEKSKNQDKEKEILEEFCKVEINISLLEAIKQVPRYAKFLKDLCVNRRRLKGDERVIVGKNVSAVLQRILPPKCGDPGPLKATGIIIHLADRTNAYSDGLIEDVLVKFNELIFPTDFYALDMDDDHSPDPSPLLLGRPFLITTHTKIDVNNGTLSMEFDGKIEVFDIDSRNELEGALTEYMELSITHEKDADSELQNMVRALQSLATITRYGLASIFMPEPYQKLLSSIVQAPVLELKPLPDHLKYAYLSDNETLSVIISAKLSPTQENKLIRVLKDHKKTIW